MILVLLQELPSNIFIIGACNPHRSDSTAASHAESDIFNTDYYVREMHPTMELLKWKYGALGEEQENDYIKAKFHMLLGIEPTLSASEEDILCHYIIESQQQVRKYVFEKLIESKVPEKDARVRCSSCVSQRDIQRVFEFYSWLLKSYANSKSVRKLTDNVNQRRAIFVSLGLVYYMRLPVEFRKVYTKHIDSSKKSFPGDLKFQTALNEELDFYVDNVVLPPGIAKTDGLKENLLAIILCCVNKVPLIIEGAPGTSKTLSFNTAMANLKGAGSQSDLFHETSVYPSLEPLFYQCSRRTTSHEVDTVFRRAENIQKHQNNDRSPQLSVVFMDEAGLPEQAHESLKILHFRLDHPVTSFVAITNHPLDAAKTNRAVSVFRSETTLSDTDDLKVLAMDCIGQHSAPTERLCVGYVNLVQDKRFKDFYGLRDFMYCLIYLRRYFKAKSDEGDDKTNEYIIRSLERNFGGVKPALFSIVRECFHIVSYHTIVFA